MTAILNGGFDASALPKRGRVAQIAAVIPAPLRKLRLDPPAILRLLPRGRPAVGWTVAAIIRGPVRRCKRLPASASEPNSTFEHDIVRISNELYIPPPGLVQLRRA